MTKPQTALILDDGELEDVRDVLEEMDVRILHRRASQLASRFLEGVDLVVTTGDRALASRDAFSGLDPDQRPTWVTIHNQDFLPLRDRMRGLGVDYLVNVNVSCEILRLLLGQILFRGDERREGERTPVSSQVDWQVGGERCGVLLAEIGPSGCRLMSRDELGARGDVVNIELPASLGGGRSVQLLGKISRIDVDLIEDALGTSSVYAVEFGLQSTQLSKFLHNVRAGKAIGTRVAQLCVTAKPARAPRPKRPNDAPEAVEAAPTIEPAEAVAAATAKPAVLAPVEAPEERRRQPRGSLRGRSLVILGDRPRVVLGQDLSARGIRVESRSELSVGSEVRVGIPCGNREEPLVLTGRVLRSVSEESLSIHFETPDPRLGIRLERMVAGLPPIAVRPSQVEGRIAS